MYVNGKFKIESNEAEVSAINGVATAISDKTIEFPASQLTSLETIASQMERIATLQTPVQSDWNVTNTESLAYIKNKPTITTPVQSDWNATDTESLSYIKNKPTIINTAKSVSLPDGTDNFYVKSVLGSIGHNITTGSYIYNSGANATTFTTDYMPKGSGGWKYGFIMCGTSATTLSHIMFMIGTDAQIGTTSNHFVSSEGNNTGLTISVASEWENDQHLRLRLIFTFSGTLYGGLRVEYFG